MSRKHDTNRDAKRGVTRFQPHPCPKCGRFHDAATDFLTGKARPRAGSIAICINCATVSIYADDRGRMRPPREAEWQEMRNNPALWEVIQRHRAAAILTKAELGPLPGDSHREDN